MWAGLPVRPRAIDRSCHLAITGQVRSEDHTRRCRARQTLTLRDSPKTTANASATLKWMCLPPRRRFASQAAANFPRSSRNQTAFRRHTASSSHRTRGQHPQAIELLLLAFQFEPKFAPSGVLERVARVPTASRRRRSWAGLSKDPVPRHGFPHPLRSACVVSNDLGGLLLSAPSGVFQPVTLVEFAVRKSST